MLDCFELMFKSGEKNDKIFFSELQKALLIFLFFNFIYYVSILTVFRFRDEIIIC